MSADDVYRTEMDESHDFDDAAAEALIAGAGRPTDADLADVVADLRMAYGTKPPPVGAEVAAFLALPQPELDATPGRVSRTRAALLAKCGAAAAVAVAALSGLAAAGALPAPMRDAMAKIGVGASPHPTEVRTGGARGRREHDNDVGAGLEHADHGGGWCPHDSDIGQRREPPAAAVATTAPARTYDGCEHGHAVAAVASGGKSNGNACPATTHRHRDDIDDHDFRRDAGTRKLARERKRKRKRKQLRECSRPRQAQDQAPAEPGQAQGQRQRFRQRPLMHASPRKESEPVPPPPVRAPARSGTR